MYDLLLETVDAPGLLLVNSIPPGLIIEFCSQLYETWNIPVRFHMLYNLPDVHTPVVMLCETTSDKIDVYRCSINEIHISRNADYYIY